MVVRTRLVLVGILVGAWAAAAFGAAAQEEIPAFAIIRGNDVQLRAEPGLDAEVVAVLQRGDEVTITGRAEAADGEEFVPVEVAVTGDTGWVRAKFIDPGSIMPLDDAERAAGDEGDEQGEADALPAAEPTPTPAPSAEPEPLCAPEDGTATEAAEPDDPLAGRLGGSRESFEARFGEPAEENRFGTTYEIEGCGAVRADFYEGVLTNVTVNAPGFEGFGESEADAETWTLEEAGRIAERLLPADAEVGEPVRNVSYVEHHPGFSESLADGVPAEVYGYVDTNPTPGQFSYVYQLRLDADEVLSIIVQLQVEDPN